MFNDWLHILRVRDRLNDVEVEMISLISPVVEVMTWSVINETFITKM
jgi:hypothetical protein